MKNKFFTEADCDMSRLSIGRSEGSISVDKANRLLEERGKVVKSYGELNEWYANGASGLLDNTHTALLINLEEIEQDSAEKIVADLAKWEDKDIGCVIQYSGSRPTGLLKILGRAKKLLEKKK